VQGQKVKQKTEKTSNLGGGNRKKKLPTGSGAGHPRDQPSSNNRKKNNGPNKDKAPPSRIRKDRKKKTHQGGNEAPKTGHTNEN